jgi:hypothetical protein
VQTYSTKKIKKPKFLPKITIEIEPEENLEGCIARPVSFQHLEEEEE